MLKPTNLARSALTERRFAGVGIPWRDASSAVITVAPKATVGSVLFILNIGSVSIQKPVVVSEHRDHINVIVPEIYSTCFFHARSSRGRIRGW